jgi:hypothetical protein
MTWGHPQHGFGYKPDPKGHTYNGFHLHPGAALLAAEIPAESSLLPSVPPIWNQRRTGSCTGHGFAGGITTTFAAHGHILPAPVWPRGLYANGRIIDRVPSFSGPQTPLADEGAMPNSLVRAMDLWGVATEDMEDDGRRATSPDYSDYLEAHVNDEPSLLELEDESMFLVRGFNAIDDLAPAKVADFCRALASGHAVMAAIYASGPAFQNAAGDVVLGPEAGLPDHWIYFGAYRTNASGKKEFLLINSWGTGWGKLGMIWVSEEFVRRGTWNILVANLGE